MSFDLFRYLWFSGEMFLHKAARRTMVWVLEFISIMSEARVKLIFNFLFSELQDYLLLTEDKTRKCCYMLGRSTKVSTVCPKRKKNLHSFLNSRIRGEWYREKERKGRKSLWISACVGKKNYFYFRISVLTDKNALTERLVQLEISVTVCVTCCQLCVNLYRIN